MRKYMLCFFLLSDVDLRSVDSLKGIWSSVANFPLFTSNFWQSFGQGFGASPSGYVYNCKIYNDTDQTVYCSIGELISLMGGYLPKPKGLSIFPIEAWGMHLVSAQPYYFEMLLRRTDTPYSSNMPYLQHDDIIGRFEGIALPNEKGSSRRYLYRVFKSKKMKAGKWEHGLSMECLGYESINNLANKNQNSTVSVGDQLSMLTIFNNTSQDFDIGFFVSDQLLEKKNALVCRTVKAYGFAQLSSFGAIKSLAPGIIAAFNQSGQMACQYKLPINIFQSASGKSMPYTLEIYNDSGDAQNSLSTALSLQGLMPGNYDIAMGNVIDITPVQIFFWNQAATNAAFNLSGKVWIVSVVDQQCTILTSVSVGQAVSFNMPRPNYGSSCYLYFVYLDESSDVLCRKYLYNFAADQFGIDARKNYEKQAQAQVALAANNDASTSTISKNQQVAAAQGVLSLHQGRMVDPKTGLTGYLLGSDLYYPRGCFVGPVYYMLPAQAIASNQPLTTVENLFILNPGSVAAPVGMPTAKYVDITNLVSVPIEE